MQYLDFEIEIASAAEGSYAVRVLRSPAGEAAGTMRLSLEDMQVGARIDALQTALLRSGVSGRAPAMPEAKSVEQFGKDLWAALFSGDVLAAFEVSRSRAKQSGQGIRLKLRFGSAELAALPWEYLYDTRKGDYLSVYTSTPLVRYVPLQQAIEPLLVTPPLRILAMVASPSDYDPLDVEREKGRLERALAKLKGRGIVELTWLDGQTPQDLSDALQQSSWHVFHFIGHGGFDAEHGEGVIVFADDTGSSRKVAGTDLGRLLGDHDPLRLAVLNSCDSARGDKVDVFSSTAAALVRRGTPAVVAMQYEITDEAAIEFSRAFYHAVAAGMPVDAAVAAARRGIALAIPNTLEWGTPVLFMRAPDGVLFNVPAPIAPPIEEPPPKPPIEEPPPKPPIEEPPPKPPIEEPPVPVPKPGPIQPSPPAPVPPTGGPEPKPGRWRRRIAIGGGVLGVLLVIGFVIAALEVPLPGRVAYATGSGIMTVAADGSDPREVPGTGPGDTDPAWAPDGSGLVYRSDSGLRVVAIGDGGSPVQLTEGNDFSPAWSPDGTTIAFASDRAGGPLQIYLVDTAGGGEPVQLRQSGVEEHDPSWSPDSSRLVFASGTRTERELVLFDPDSGFVQITSNVADDVDPAWSPDGEWIAFASTSAGNFDIWRMQLDGTGLEQLTTGPAVDHDPAWSPDGRAIAFSRSEGATTQIVVLMLESREEIQISGGDAGGSYPTWR